MNDEQSQPTVHVVDDEAVIRDSIRALLGSVGLSCATYESTTEFLEACDPTIRGCLLLDVRIPGVSGLELLQQLPKLGFTLPILMLTGHGDASMSEESRKNGARQLIEKPFDPDQLVELVKSALADDTR